MSDYPPAPASPATGPPTAAASSGHPSLPRPASGSGFWFRRRSLPLPTWRLWLCLVLGLGTGVVLFIRNVHGWLAVTEPVPDAKYLVVEGWVPDYVLSSIVSLAEDAGTQRVFCTGIPLEQGSYLSAYRNYATVAATSLAKLGLDPQLICPVPAPAAKNDRTITMALALKAVLDGEPVPSTGRKINIVTLSTHARRSRAIFRGILGPEWEVGVISIEARDYDPARWYRQSQGAKNVITELVALAVQERTASSSPSGIPGTYGPHGPDPHSAPNPHGSDPHRLPPQDPQ